MRDNFHYTQIKNKTTNAEEKDLIFLCFFSIKLKMKQKLSLQSHAQKKNISFFSLQREKWEIYKRRAYKLLCVCVCECLCVCNNLRNKNSNKYQLDGEISIGGRKGRDGGIKRIKTRWINKFVKSNYD